MATKERVSLAELRSRRAKLLDTLEEIRRRSLQSATYLDDKDLPLHRLELFARGYREALETFAHDCEEHPVPYVSDGPLGHGFECGICGAFLQAG